MLRRTRVVAVACAHVLTLASCGSADDAIRDYNQSDIAVFDISSVCTDPEIAAMIPRAAKVDGELTIGSNLYYAPADFKQRETPVGYEMDVVRAVAARMGFDLEVQEPSFDSTLPQIPKRYEAGASAFTITNERTANLNMTQYYEAGTSWAVAAGNPSKFAPGSICGRAIGVQTGTFQDETVAKTTKKCHKQLTIQRCGAQENVTLALSGGRIETTTADSSVINYAIHKAKGALEAAGSIMEKVPQGIVVSKDDPALTAAIQAPLQSLMDDETLRKIFKSWNIDENIASKALLNPKV